jgi:hypothetical protein
MTKRKLSSPRPTLDIHQDLIDNATRSNSSACVYADAIKAQVPNATRVEVDLATMSWTDPKAGVRYTYLTPHDARLVLMAFDRGIRPMPHELQLRGAVRVRGIVTSPARAEKRARRLAELTQREAEGALSSIDRRALSNLRNAVERPTSIGRTAITDDGAVVGGAHIRGEKRERLLPSNARVFGASLANASGEAFDALLEAARQQGRAEALGERDTGT